MYARRIQIRAALLAVIALAVIAAFASVSASAATSSQCQPNPYTPAGRACIERQARSQGPRHKVVKKARLEVAKKHRSSQCPDPLYWKWLNCR